jgi:protein-export membrane protein SecD
MKVLRPKPHRHQLLGGFTKDMKSRNMVLLVIIIILAVVAIFIVWPNSPGLHVELGPISVHRDFAIKKGLDLQGGLQVLLGADLPPDQEVEPGAMDQVATIIGNRVNALGVVEPLVQTQGSRRIIVELPGVENPEDAIATFRETGLLEFLDAGYVFLPPGIRVETTFPLLASEGATGGEITPTDVPTPSADAPITSSETLTVEAPSEPTDVVELDETEPVTATDPAEPTQVFPTVLTGNQLRSATAYRDPNSGEFGIQFELSDEGADVFADFTTANADYGSQPFYYLAIALDKEIISSPHIQSPIPDGQGIISGDFDLEEAQKLAIQLRYGALPIPLRVEMTRLVGPTLGQDSLQRSIQAGIVGLSIVFLFMLIYYRLPGLLADMALFLYGLLNLAVYMVGWPVLLIISLLMIVSYLVDRKDQWPLILGGILLLVTIALASAGFTGVTLTLPAITGFILSTGMAVDANILVFERMKEELRAGRDLDSALEAGFSRAWTSIRDSNISTLITCAILYYFGSTFGAGAVRGFAITLALGIIINMFTAITVTRTFMRLAFHWLGDKLRDHPGLLAA